MQVVSFKTPKGPKVAIYSKKSYFSEKIIPFSYLLLAKSMKFILKLKNHTRVASVLMKAKEFDCPQCDYCTNNANHLKVHIQFKHEGFRFQCELCDNSQTTRSNLIKHMKQKHPSE